MKKIWETKGEYQTLDDLVKYDYYTSMGSSTYSERPGLRPYNGYEALKDWPRLREIAKKKFEGLGFKRLAFVGNGDFAIVLKTVENQVVRISVDSQENKRPIHPAILQPHVTFLLRDEENAESPTLRIEVLAQIKDKNGHAIPEITTDGLRPEHTEILKDVLRKSGLDPHDLAPKNIALLGDGTPVVIDGGAVEQKPGKEIILDESVLKNWLHTGDDGITTWKQYALHPEISKGEIQGTIKPEDIKILKVILGEDSSLYKAALEDGLYRAELGQLMIDASEAHEQELAKGASITFRETFERTRRAYNKKAGPGEDWPKLR